ncbi:MAG TPA: 2-amino-4-hydroxy-6-hydroxymethyldihydropteridine diphosphokinase [Bacillales bacterium]|nr:2-amino-4-hydroxy-6-hydroxymethyldihydropteridine diphosphokinase [Bacillales bacterium]
MTTAYIGLGTNIGERDRYLHEAVLRMDGHRRIHVTRLSSIYETEPIGCTDQADFLNMVAEVSTELAPDELLHATASVENQLGRTREVRWGPRTIDLDILLYNQATIETDALTIPHPRMHERAFVLVPLSELNPSFQVPGTNVSLSEYVKQISGKEGVRLWRLNSGEERFALFES